MKKKLVIGLVMLIALCAVVSALAQSQSQGQQSQSSAPVFPGAASLDNQGVRGYKLGPGDILDVKIWGQQELNTVAEIDEDGNLSSLPFIDEPIPAKCHTELEIQKRVTEAYDKYLVKPRVSVRTVERRSRPPATIYGAVYKPTQVATIRRQQLHEVVAASGGFTASAGGIIQIVHTTPELCPEPGETLTGTKGSDIGEVRNYEISKLKAGLSEGDPFIRPGDILYVAEGDQVYVTGLVYNPQILIMKEPITLLTAVAKAGGLQRLANPKEIHIWRKKDGKLGGNDIKVNLEAIRKNQQPDVALEADDIIEVRELGFFAPKNLGDMLKGLPLTAVTKLP